MKTPHHTYSVWLRELLRRPLKPAALTEQRETRTAVGFSPRSSLLQQTVLSHQQINQRQSHDGQVGNEKHAQQ